MCFVKIRLLCQEKKVPNSHQEPFKRLISVSCYHFTLVIKSQNWQLLPINMNSIVFFFCLFCFVAVFLVHCKFGVIYHTIVRSNQLI